MKKILVFALILFVAFTLAAGGSKSNSSDGDSNVIKIGLIIENTIDDKGWCQSMHDGILQAQRDLGNRIQYRYQEKMAVVDAGSIAREFIADGYDLIIAHGAQYKNVILELAEQYPDVCFAFGTSDEIGPPNVFTYMPESEETGYLSGLLAAFTTKSNIIGLVGPVDGGDSARYNRGFVKAVKTVNPDAKILLTYSGSFSDYVKAGEIATSQIRNGADVLTGASQQAIGALRATAEDSRALWVGQDLEQFNTPEGQAKCLAASSYNYAAVIKSIINDMDNGVKGGKNIPMNFNNGGFVFAFNDTLANYVSDRARNAVNTALDAFIGKSGILSDYNSVDMVNL